jgi:DNA helicase-2/ATP-dependent DNA helicase PcrA
MFADDLRARAEAQHEPTVSAVTLATLHSAKGLEWNEVFIVGLNEGMLPIAYAKGFEAIDEERRLLYVGITRARRRLELSWARRGGHRGEREPSRFLLELGTRTPHAGDARGAEETGPARRA